MSLETKADKSRDETKPVTRQLPELLDWREACAALGGSIRPISRATLDRLTKSGLLIVVRPAPGIVRWSSAGILAYLESVSFPRKAA